MALVLLLGGSLAGAGLLAHQEVTNALLLLQGIYDVTSPSAADVPADWADKIYHATLTVGDIVILGGDQPSNRYNQPQGFELVLPMDDPLAAERVFAELAEGGTIKIPLQETFWASRFGVLVDRFGIPWTVNCQRVEQATT